MTVENVAETWYQKNAEVIRWMLNAPPTLIDHEVYLPYSEGEYKGLKRTTELRLPFLHLAPFSDIKCINIEYKGPTVSEEEIDVGGIIINDRVSFARVTIEVEFKGKGSIYFPKSLTHKEDINMEKHSRLTIGDLPVIGERFSSHISIFEVYDFDNKGMSVGPGTSDIYPDNDEDQHI
jgi:hypothetical protein